MSLRRRITQITIACFVTMALGLLFDGHRREAAVQEQLEAAQLLLLDVSWSGFVAAEQRRLQNLTDVFRLAPGAAGYFDTRDPRGLEQATVHIRADLKTTHFQALAPDGSAFFDSRGADVGAPVLPAALVRAIVGQSTPRSGLLRTPAGGVAVARAVPVFATSGVIGVAVVWSDVTPSLTDLSGAVGTPIFLLGPDGMLARSAGAALSLSTAGQSRPALGDGVSFLRQRDRILRIASIALPPTLDGQTISLVGVTDDTEAITRQTRVRFVSYLALGTAMLLFFAIVNWSLRSSFEPLTAIVRSLEALTQGRTDLRVPAPTRADEIGRLAGTFETFRQGMQARDRLGRLQQELDVATRIQAQCLPRTFPHVPGVAFAAQMTPMREVGGDFYDIFALPDGRVGLVIADVSDKGVGAALFMAISRTAMRSTALAARDPAECVAQVNAYLCTDNDAMLFVTLIYAILDPATGQVTLCNAGHNPPAILDAAGQVRFVTAEPQLALGVFEDATYQNQSLHLTAGSRLVLYTDGITEAMNRAGTEYGEDRLAETLSGTGPVSAEALLTGLIDSVERFLDGQGANDDLTCLAMAFEGGAGRAPASRDDRA